METQFCWDLFDRTYALQIILLRLFCLYENMHEFYAILFAFNKSLYKNLQECILVFYKSDY